MIHYSLYNRAIIADTFIGNYWTILLFSLLCYLPGLILIALVAKPYLFGDTFPMKPMYAAYLFFYPCGELLFVLHKVSILARI